MSVFSGILLLIANSMTLRVKGSKVWPRLFWSAFSWLS